MVLPEVLASTSEAVLVARRTVVERATQRMDRRGLLRLLVGCWCGDCGGAMAQDRY